MAANPTNPFQPAASNNAIYYSSGLAIIPTSGSPAASGPWMEETQDLTIDYVRVPWTQVSAHTINLSTGSQAHQINATRLALKVNANYRKDKTYIGHDLPNASGYQQTQRFQIIAASADHLGNTYGDLSAGASGTAMGPAGTIITSQPWKARRPWDDSVDVTAVESMTGYLYYVAKSTCGGHTHIGNSNAEYQTDFEGAATSFGHVGGFHKNQWMAHDADARLQVVGSHYNLNGPYSTDQETTVAIFNLIDSMGSKVTNIDFMAEPTSDGPSVPGFTEGFVEYSINRHDYTA